MFRIDGFEKLLVKDELDLVMQNPAKLFFQTALGWPQNPKKKICYFTIFLLG